MSVRTFKLSRIALFYPDITTGTTIVEVKLPCVPFVVELSLEVLSTGVLELSALPLLSGMVLFWG